MKRTWNLAVKGWPGLAAAGVLASCLLTAAPTGADDSDIFRFRATPNVLIIVDDSGSMARTYGGSDVGDLDGQTRSTFGGTGTGATSLTGPGASSRIDVAWRVLYQLLNADASVPSGLTTPYPTLRSHVSPDSSPSNGYDYNQNLTTADENALKVRLGLMIYGDGGTYGGINDIKVPIAIAGTDSNQPPFTAGKTYRSIWQQIKTNYTPENNPTPMSRSLQAARNTFFVNARTNDGSNACRKKFVILVTDGEDTSGSSALSPVPASSGTGAVPKYYGPGGSQPDNPTDTNYGKLGTPPTGTSTIWQFFNPNGYAGSSNTGQKARNSGSIAWAKNLAVAAAPIDNVQLFVIGVGMLGDSNGNDQPHLRVLRRVLRRMAQQEGTDLTSAEYNSAAQSGDNFDSANIGAGKVFFADNADALLAALQFSLDSILLQAYSFTAPVVPAVRTTDSNRLYLASFIPDNPPETFWAGSCASINLNSDGSVPANLVPATNWDAGDRLTSANRDYGTNSRNVYTSSVSGGVWSREDFFTGNSVSSYLTSAPSLLGLSTVAQVNNVVDNVVMRRLKTRRMGDIYHSTPVIIGAPSKFFIDTGFSTPVGGASQSFRDANATRQRVIYAGANDGMLHAFSAGTFDALATPPGYNAGTGEEMFAYVPKSLLPKLKDMTVTTTSTHQYMVDSSPKAADVWADTNNDNIKQTSEWKTVLIAGERKGGRGLFALDVTSPQSLGTSNYPQVMWEIDNAAVANLGQTWSDPNIGLVRIQEGGVTKDRWVAFVGGGYWHSTTLKNNAAPGDTSIVIIDNTGFAPSGTQTLSVGTETGITYTSNSATTIAGIPASGTGSITTTHTAGEVVTYSAIGSGFYVIDIKLGKVIWKWERSDDSNMRYPITSSPTAVDINSDGRVNYVYVVDTGNQLWRFNVGTAAPFDNTTNTIVTDNTWNAVRIFGLSSPAIAQRSFNKVDVAFDRGITPWVFFGTGDREKPEELGTGRIYAIRDDGTGYPYSESNLSNLSSVIANTADNTATGTVTTSPPQRGWFANLPNTNEKALSDVVVFNNNLFFTTFTSNTTNLCAGGGDARLYGINTGLAEAFPGSDMTAGAGGLLPDSGTDRVRSRLLAGGGIPSSPVVSMSASGGARLYVGTTNTASVLSFAIDAPTVFKRIKSWKEYIDQ
jgi:Tfp pilus tip-associated adhesin PilY1